MPDYTNKILKSFSQYKGIVKYPEVVSALDEMLNKLNNNGFNKLVGSIFSREGERAYDLMFEAWLIRMLLLNPEIENLEYEPEDMGSNAPDIKFHIKGVRFDLQVKRVYSVSNTQNIQHFQRVFEERSHQIKKPWFLSICFSEDFQKSDTDSLFYFIRNGIDKNAFQPDNNQIPENFYQWPDTGEAKAKFSFFEAKGEEAHKHLQIGIVVESNINSDKASDVIFTPLVKNDKKVRKTLKEKLDRSRHTLQLAPDSKQINLVVLQPDGGLFMDREDVAEALYGDEEMLIYFDDDNGIRMHHMQRMGNGLFNGGYSKICGVILISSSISVLSEEIEGVFLPNPIHIDILRDQNWPFPTMLTHIEKAWGLTES